MHQGQISSEFIIKGGGGAKNTLISGYASVFGIVDSYNDMILKGAFKNANSEKTKFLWQHDSLKPIGVIKSLAEDDYGLKIEAEINNLTLAGFEAAALIKQRAVDGLSIGFSLAGGGANYDAQGVRIIEQVELMEISIVTFPANKDANIQHIKNRTFSQSFKHSKDLNRLDYLVKQLKDF